MESLKKDGLPWGKTLSPASKRAVEISARVEIKASLIFNVSVAKRISQFHNYLRFDPAARVRVRVKVLPNPQYKWRGPWSLPLPKPWLIRPIIIIIIGHINCIEMD